MYPEPYIIFENSDFLVVHKPAGQLTHPTEKGETDTLADFLRVHFPAVSSVGDAPEVRPGIVHRLDREASGLLVVAKTSAAFNNLKKQFQERKVEKEYFILVHGKILRDWGTINFPLARTRDGKMGARPEDDENTREAVTEFEVVKRYANATLVKAHPKTGRTHQIRVHFHAYGHPLVGDPLYRQKKYKMRAEEKLKRIFLHACRLAFTDLNGERVEFTDPLPSELEEFLNHIT
ncbi:MAG: pseudouridine synthase, RluA family [Candidatus Magasanikbacteria bacterium]|nr:pseudouridine synthase, RluA family [Candidatus Magasanikbacteria bacterium]